MDAVVSLQHPFLCVKMETKSYSRVQLFVAECGSAKSWLSHFLQKGSSDHLLRDAARMSWKTSSGWETGDAWLDAISIVVAPILLAIKRSRSGLIVRSFLETRYHDGTCFQAGAPDGVLKQTGAIGF